MCVVDWRLYIRKVKHFRRAAKPGSMNWEYCIYQESQTLERTWYYCTEFHVVQDILSNATNRQDHKYGKRSTEVTRCTVDSRSDLERQSFPPRMLTSYPSSPSAISASGLPLKPPTLSTPSIYPRSGRGQRTLFVRRSGLRFSGEHKAASTLLMIVESTARKGTDIVICSFYI